MIIFFTTKIFRDVVLSNQDNFFQGYENIKKFVSSHVGSYFDSKTDLEFERSIMFVRFMSTINILNIVFFQTLFATQSRRFSRFIIAISVDTIRRNRALNLYYKNFAVYRELNREGMKFCKIETQLRNRFQIIVLIHKAVFLLISKSVKQGFKNLKTITEPSKNRIRQNIQINYQKLMAMRFQDGSTNDSNDGMTKGKTLLMKTIEYQKSLLNGLSNVSFVGQRMFDLTIYFQSIELKTIISLFYIEVSLKIQNRGNRKKQNFTLRYAKSRTSRSTFSIIYSDQETFEYIEKKFKKKNINTKNKKSQSRDKSTIKNEVFKKTFTKKRESCKKCDENHNIKNCFLMLNRLAVG